MCDPSKTEGSGAEPATTQEKTKEFFWLFSQLRLAIGKGHEKTAVVTLASIAILIISYFPLVNLYYTNMMKSELSEALKGVSVTLRSTKVGQVPHSKEQAILAVVAKHRNEIEEGKDLPPQYLLQLGTVSFSLGDNNRALRYYEKGLERALEEKDELNEAAARANIAVLLHDERGAIDKALEQAGKALAIHDRQKKTKEKGDDLATIGQIYVRRREFRRAVVSFEQASLLYEQRGKIGRKADMKLALVLRFPNTITYS